MKLEEAEQEKAKLLKSELTSKLEELNAKQQELESKQKELHLSRNNEESLKTTTMILTKSKSELENSLKFYVEKEKISEGEKLILHQSLSEVHQLYKSQIQKLESEKEDLRSQLKLLREEKNSILLEKKDVSELELVRANLEEEMQNLKMEKDEIEQELKVFKDEQQSKKDLEKDDPELAKFLESQKLTHLSAKFKSEKIELWMFEKFSEDTFGVLGLKVGDRQKIIKYLEGKNATGENRRQSSKSKYGKII